ncbi:PREDICTED: uncharacterized protein LOC106102299 [Papilio polytes]|uniref:uncharacterized protein LOC106102299 n=1 Tax=Papilio polytes TaxID=76194 RepID=UPI0006768A79|nr:PREDICTED: uncharacterized protein LOC106102299 [Papilio polytes]
MGVKIAAICLVLVIFIFQEAELKSMRVPRQVTSDFQNTVDNTVNATDDSEAVNLGSVVTGIIVSETLCSDCQGKD